MLSGGRLGMICVGLIFSGHSLVEAAGPEPVLLWPEGAPGAVGNEDQDKPQVRIYLPQPDKATGAALVICPGGGYGALATDHEGHQVARWANSIGVAAFVVKYRLAPRYRHPAPLQDAQRAVRYVRANSETFHVSPARIGILGFSAGGHLASTVATHFDDGDKSSSDSVARQSSRPDFAVLCYPVISLTETFAHQGSAKNLLGDAATPEQLLELSNEKHVTPRTPPTFLFHTGEDAGVPVENSLAFYAACRKAKVPAELHVYQNGPHGVGLAPADPAVYGWKDRLADWLRANGFLADVQRAAIKGQVTIQGNPMRWGMISFVPDEPNKPIAWAMVSGGKFTLDAHHGPVLGKNKVLIYDLGSVEPRPTIEDFRVMSQILQITVTEDQNEISFDVD